MPDYSHVVVLTANDLTQTTVNTLQSFTAFALKAGDQIKRVTWYLKRAFENTLDAAFNSATISIGDNAAVTTHLAAAEANVNGTEIIWRTGNTVVLYTAADIFKITVNSMAAKALNDINRGELLIFVSLTRVKNVADAVASTQLSKT